MFTITHDSASNAKSHQFQWPAWVLNIGISIRNNAMKELVGCRFGRLYVSGYAGYKGKSPMWECICDCGKTTITHGSSLKSGSTKSCGCGQKESARAMIKKYHTTHNLSNSSEYLAWKNMVQRCTNKNNKAYKHYGGRCIEVCDRWLTFENFYRDMGENPGGLELDRRDNNKGYSLDNCRWVSHKKNTRNTRGSHIITFKGISKCITEWAESTEISAAAIGHRIRRGWTVERALTQSLEISRV